MSVHLLMSAGRGPQECAWALAGLLRRLEADAIRQHVTVRRVRTVPGDRPDTYRSVLLHVAGAGAEPFAASWTGTLCWQAPSPYRAGTGRKNWYVTAQPCGVDAARATFTESDVDIVGIRTGGPGGQHRNKASTAVRATHAATRPASNAQHPRSARESRYPPVNPAPDSIVSMPWLPVDFVHPDRVELVTGHHLRPIRAADVDLDYPAVMGSRERLWARYGETWHWPPADMTYEHDRADLARHETEIATHESFNYALFDAAETALLGCVYIDPPEQAGANTDADAEVDWWVVDGLVGTDVERALDQLVPRWIAGSWPFRHPRLREVDKSATPPSQGP